MLAFCSLDSFDGFFDGLALDGFDGLALDGFEGFDGLAFPLHFFPLQGFFLP